MPHPRPGLDLLARTLGISVSSAVRRQQISTGDWTTYAAEVSRRDQQKQEAK
jgi:hypothetical protein